MAFGFVEGNHRREKAMNTRHATFKTWHPASSKPKFEWKLRVMRLGMEQNILHIAWNHPSLIRDFRFELSHAPKHSNDFTVFLPEFPQPRSWVRASKTFSTLFAILIYSLRELRSEYVLCVFDVKRQRKHKTGDTCGSEVWQQFFMNF